MSAPGLPSQAFWKDKCVGITGHQGFKGAWLCKLLERLGAQSHGYGQDDRSPLLYRDLQVANHSSTEGNINDHDRFKNWLDATQPEFLIHLAAQPLVRKSYLDPLGTFQDNIMGTATVLQAARDVSSLRTLIIVTSDKVYSNNESGKAFVEDDRLGGDDPYSASKAATEIIARAMEKSFFQSPGAPQVHTVRAGNVIGGGDWATDRLLPDAARAFASGKQLVIRSPHSIRPWQHVLDPLAGYLKLCENAAENKQPTFQAWNFGPSADAAKSVEQVVTKFCSTWGDNAVWAVEDADPLRKESHLLSVDSSRASRELGWQPRWGVDEAVKRTALWYNRLACGAEPAALVESDIQDFMDETESTSKC